MIKVIKITVVGRVQGVGYRAATQHTARHLGLRGTVRNLADGRVEIVAQGESGALERLVSWCWQGPPAARVDRVSVEPLDDVMTMTTKGFLVVHD